MTVTAFGAVFLPVALFVFLFRRDWLVALLCVSIVLLSPSVVDIRWAGVSYGLTPFLLVASLVATDLLLRWRKAGQFRAGLAAQRPIVKGLALFALLSLIATLSFPLLFEGTEVYAPLNQDGIAGAPSDLVWSASNWAQIVNLLLIATVAVWLLQQAQDPELPRRMLIGMLLALLLSALVGLQQRLAWNGLVPMWEGFWASNPLYDQNYRSWAGPVPRVSWPFVEPSYASAWFAAMLGGFVAMFLADVQRHRALLGAMVAIFALANTLGATGLLTVIVFGGLAVVVVFGVLLLLPAQREGLLYRLTLAVLVCSCVWLASYLVLRHYELYDQARAAFGGVLRGDDVSMLGDVRSHANRHALKVLIESWGLGVGMGSNRASSYLATLLSNRGVLGFLLFLAVIGLQFRALALRIKSKPTAPTVFFFGAGISALIAVSIAIPDQNWPVLWMILLGGLVCLGAEDTQGHVATAAAEPERH